MLVLADVYWNPGVTVSKNKVPTQGSENLKYDNDVFTWMFCFIIASCIWIKCVYSCRTYAYYPPFWGTSIWSNNNTTIIAQSSNYPTWLVTTIVLPVALWSDLTFWSYELRIYRLRSLSFLFRRFEWPIIYVEVQSPTLHSTPLLARNRWLKVLRSSPSYIVRDERRFKFRRFFPFFSLVTD